MASHSENLMWAFMEEAVIRDRGCDEEQNLRNMVRSYLFRRGFADTLAAFESEACGRVVAHSDSLVTTCLSSPEASVGTDGDVRTRKSAQLLCFNGAFEEAADVMPVGSRLRVRLLALEALRKDDAFSGMAYATKKIAPLIPTCDDPLVAHRVYLQTVTSLLSGRNKEDFLEQTKDLAALANEVNEGLLRNTAPSALNVLLSWVDWQEKARF